MVLSSNTSFRSHFRKTLFGGPSPYQSKCDQHVRLFTDVICLECGTAVGGKVRF